MKIVPTLRSMAVVCIIVLSSSSVSINTASATSDSIESIRKHYAAINKNIKRYRVVDRELSGYSAEGGSLTAYFDGDSIVKLNAKFFGEMGRVDEEYYFWNGRLIFVYRREHGYDLPLSGKVISTKANRFYFDNDRMIRWIDEGGRQVPSSKNGFVEKQNEYLENSREFVKLAWEKPSANSGH